jgi:hypothetical protein
VVSHGNRELRSLTNGSSFFDQSLDLKCILPVSIEGKWTCGVPDQHSEDTSQENAGHESIQHGLTPTPYITSTVEGAVSASTRNRQLAPRRIPIAISRVSPPQPVIRKMQGKGGCREYRRVKAKRNRVKDKNRNERLLKLEEELLKQNKKLSTQVNELKNEVLGLKTEILSHAVCDNHVISIPQ